MEAFVLIPRLCATRETSNHSLAVALLGQSLFLMRSFKISAPPPGIASIPASFNSCNTSRMDLPLILAKCVISTPVNPFK